METTNDNQSPLYGAHVAARVIVISLSWATWIVGLELAFTAAQLFAIAALLWVGGVLHAGFAWQTFQRDHLQVILEACLEWSQVKRANHYGVQALASQLSVLGSLAFSGFRHVPQQLPKPRLWHTALAARLLPVPDFTPCE